MNIYDLNQIFEIFNNDFNLQLNEYDNPKEVAAIKRTMMRHLQRQGITAPYNNINEVQKNKLYDDMRLYLLKKAEETTPELNQDKLEYNRMIANNTPDRTTYYEAYQQLAINFITLTLQNQTNKFFAAPKFKKDYDDFLKKLDHNGYPKPGYTRAKNKLLDPNRYFQTLEETPRKNQNNL